MDLKLLEKLTNSVGIGHLKGATEAAKAELSKYAEVQEFGTLGLVAKINKNAEKTIMVEAHIDEVGFIVTHIFDSGFLKVAAVGGNDGRILPATPITVHGKSDIPAVFVSTPPHLSKGDEEAKNADEILLDTGTFEAVKETVSVGDYATYRKTLTPLSGTRVSAKSLDDRAGVACLIELAKRLRDKPLSVNVVLCLTEQEELGTRGAKTASFAIDCDEAISIDVTFGNSPDIPATKCGRLGKGGMIGLSPILNRKISDKLISLAKEKGIPYQLEVMGGASSTDADVISISKGGVPTGLISIPLRNMHTPAETVDTLDIDSIVDLLEAYILSGGAV